MKLAYEWKRRGTCHVCGKPTKLLIHTACGEKKEAERNAPTGFNGMTPGQHAAAGHRRHAAAYRAGRLGWLPK